MRQNRTNHVLGGGGTTVKSTLFACSSVKRFNVSGEVGSKGIIMLEKSEAAVINVLLPPRVTEYVVSLTFSNGIFGVPLL